MVKEKISDHETIKIELMNEDKIDFSNYHTVISWKNYNMDQLINNLLNCDWANFNEFSIDDKIDFLRNNLEKAVKPMIQNVQIKLNTNDKKRFDSELSNLKKENVQKYIIWSQSQIRDDWKRYVETRNCYNKLIKMKKDESIRKEITKASASQITMWKSLKKTATKQKQKN